MKILCVVYCIQSERIVVLWRVQSSETIRITKQRQSSRASYIGTFFLYFFLFLLSFVRSFTILFFSQTQLKFIDYTLPILKWTNVDVRVGSATQHTVQSVLEKIFSVFNKCLMVWVNLSEEKWVRRTEKSTEIYTEHWTTLNSIRTERIYSVWDICIGRQCCLYWKSTNETSSDSCELYFYTTLAFCISFFVVIWITKLHNIN
jgi:hypothetical protein